MAADAAESALYAAVEDFIGDAYRAASPEKRSAVGFVMTVYRRRLASSFEALKRTLNGRLMRTGGITEEDASQDETSDEVMSGEEVACLAAEASEGETINERRKLSLNGHITVAAIFFRTNLDNVEAEFAFHWPDNFADFGVTDGVGKRFDKTGHCCPVEFATIGTAAGIRGYSLGQCSK